MRTLDVLTASVATVARLGAGVTTRPAARRPARLLRLYEFEGCPFCRKVREALTELDLDALVLPCPRGGERYRPHVVATGGRASFPFLEDPNTGVALQESDDIVAYLYETYGERPPPRLQRAGRLNDLTSALASAARPLAGSRKRPARVPEEPLELWSFEASPFSRLVREKLCALELPYVLHTVGRASWAEHFPLQLRDLAGFEPAPSTPARRDLQGRAGRVQVPYLEDPNTGESLLESAAILAYLDETYAL